MPIELNTFRSAVQGSSDKGFIRASRRFEGQITQYGNRIFETRRNYANEGENTTIREEFYKALTREHLSDSTLASIRQQLHLNDDGTFSGGQVDDTRLSRRLVKQILKQVDNDLSKQEFVKNMQKNGYRSDEMKEFITTQPEFQNDVLTEMNKQAILERLQDKARTDLQSALENFHYENFLEALAGPMKGNQELERIFKAYQQSFVDGKGSMSTANVWRNDYNDELMKVRQNDIKNALRQIIASSDSIALTKNEQEELIDIYLRDCRDFLQKELGRGRFIPATIDNKEIQDGVAKFFEKKLGKLKPMLEALETEFADKPAAVKEYLRNEIIHNTSFSNPDYLSFYSKNMDLAVPILELGCKPQPTMQEFVDAFSKLVSKLNALDIEIHEKIKGYGGDDIYTTFKNLYGMSGALFKSNNKTENIHLSKGLVDIATKFCKETTYIKNHSDSSRNPDKNLKYSEEQAETLASSFKSNLEYLFEYFGEELNREEIEKPADGISKELYPMLKSLDFEEINNAK